MNQMIKNFALFLLLLNLFPLRILAQDIRFKHLTDHNGLSQNLVRSIAQDQEGFMWFGTKDGLNKYDGYKFSVFQNQPNNPSSISYNYISKLFTDSYGKLWIGTDNGTVNIFNNETQSFQRIFLPLAQSNSNNSKEINTLAQDKTGSIWIGTNGNGIFKITFINNAYAFKNIRQYHNEASGKYPLCSNIIKKNYVDDSNNLWIGTNNGLNKMDIQKETFESFYFDVKHPDAPESSEDFCISAIAEANKDHYGLVPAAVLLNLTHSLKTMIFTRITLMFLDMGGATLMQL